MTNLDNHANVLKNDATSHDTSTSELDLSGEAYINIRIETNILEADIVS